ncbi:hypothetical protein ACMC56_15575 [Campylobacterota bacterium DY0563]
MIIDQKDKKIFGIVHLQEDFKLIGFCINKEDKNSQEIDIYANNQKIDTILSNTSNSKLENIYDIEVSNSCFEYRLPSQYIKEDTILEFKYENTSESILNSPIKFSEIKNFNKKLFLFSLKESDTEQITYSYDSKTIGFLATEENLKDEGFIRYIKRLLTDFQDIKFKAFYLEKSLIPLLENVFEGKIKLLELKNISDIYKNTKILILNGMKIFDNIVLKKCFIKELYLSSYYPNQEAKIEDSNNKYILDLLKNNYSLFSISKDEIENYNNHLLISDKILLKNTTYENQDTAHALKQTIFERNINLIKLALHDNKFIKNTIEFRKKIHSLLK